MPKFKPFLPFLGTALLGKSLSRRGWISSHVYILIVILIDQLASGEIEDMIETVDRNKDGKISYSEFRVTIIDIMKWIFTHAIAQVMMGGFPLIIPTEPVLFSFINLVPVQCLMFHWLGCQAKAGRENCPAKIIQFNYLIVKFDI